jgi:hypothetical protein
MTSNEPLPHGWKRLIVRLKDKWRAVLLVIASEEVFLDRMDFDKGLSRSAKDSDR